MPDGIKRKMVFLPLITSVCPALWPPWKRTTPSALSVSQSTILPLPSSPHWVPTTTTLFAMLSRASPITADRLPRLASAHQRGATHDPFHQGGPNPRRVPAPPRRHGRAARRSLSRAPDRSPQAHR